MLQPLLVSRDQTSLRQRATDTLRAALLNGMFAPGQKLSERELCESLGVSRSCVRESLQHLQASRTAVLRVRGRVVWRARGSPPLPIR